MRILQDGQDVQSTHLRLHVRWQCPVKPSGLLAGGGRGLGTIFCAARVLQTGALKGDYVWFKNVEGHSF